MLAITLFLLCFIVYPTTAKLIHKRWFHVAFGSIFIFYIFHCKYYSKVVIFLNYFFPLLYLQCYFQFL